MKRFQTNENLSSSKRNKNDDEYLFQGNDADEALIAHLVQVEPLQRKLSIPNPPMNVDDDQNF